MTIAEPASLDELQVAARQARAAYDIPTAIDLYTRILAAPETSADRAASYDTLVQRAICYRTLGRMDEASADLDLMSRLADEMGDVRRQIDVMARRITISAQRGEGLALRDLG